MFLGPVDMFQCHEVEDMQGRRAPSLTHWPCLCECKSQMGGHAAVKHPVPAGAGVCPRYCAGPLNVALPEGPCSRSVSGGPCSLVLPAFWSRPQARWLHGPLLVSSASKASSEKEGAG